MLEKDNSVSIHTKNLQYLATEIFKVKMSLSPIIMNEIFKFSENSAYNLRSGETLVRHNTKTNHYGIESISNLGAKIWTILPSELKNANSLETFKSKIKKWIPTNCPCKLCKSYIQNVGFL